MSNPTILFNGNNAAKAFTNRIRNLPSTNYYVYTVWHDENGLSIIKVTHFVDANEEKIDCLSSCTSYEVARDWLVGPAIRSDAIIPPLVAEVLKVIVEYFAKQ